jgi:2-keto-4-pentenoate hydratase/2-oxohepta-3-ene-1,7-dioic acid hydratase in catechol pathway
MKRFLIIFLVLFTTSLYAESISYARAQDRDTVIWGIVENENFLELEKAPWLSSKTTGRVFKLTSLKLLTPVEPSKVLAIGLIYRSHSGESGASRPELFAKFPSSLASSGDVFIPSEATNIHYEGELVIVIGKKIKNVSISEAKQAIFAVTIGNDISERNWQSSDLQWIRGKASDGFAPVGPYLVTGVNWSDLMVSTYVNGELRQNESTAMLIHSPEEIVSWTSKYITLEPGDIIFTGTPGRTQAIKNGDVVEVKIEKIGSLINRFIWD